MLLRTCWHRNFILLALVCMCWNGSVARQKKQENEQNEPSTESIPRVSTNTTTPATTPPEDTGLELKHPRKTSGNFSTNDTLSLDVLVACVQRAVYPLIFAKNFHSLVL